MLVVLHLGLMLAIEGGRHACTMLHVYPFLILKVDRSIITPPLGLRSMHAFCHSAFPLCTLSPSHGSPYQTPMGWKG
jgi:hypothetical protein